MVGAGAGTEGGTIGFAVSENNFLGKGIRLGTNLDITEDSIKGSFSVTNPNLRIAASIREWKIRVSIFNVNSVRSAVLPSLITRIDSI